MSRISNLRAGYAAATGQTAPAAVPAVSVAPLLDVAGATGYAIAALNQETLYVSTALEGTRNDTLNKAAFNMAQLVAGGQLPPALVVAELTAAARANGLDAVEITRTLQSALPAGEKMPRQQVPDETEAWLNSLPQGRKAVDNIPEFIPAPSNVGENHATPPETGPAAPETAQPAPNGPAYQEQLFNRDVALELHREHVKDTAKRMLKAEREAGQGKPRMIGLSAFLEEPDEDVEYRITEVWPTGGRVVFAAQYKAGKSTAVGNVIRSLADGDPFLGQFTAAPAGRIVLIDNELDQRTLRRWLRDQGIHNTDAVTLIPLRGMVGSFDILDDETRRNWAAAIATQKPDVIILDCLRPVLDALGLSEDKDAGRFLVAFDSLLHTSGATEALVVHHMGHGGERSRGDSRILDWPDATWKLIRQDAEDMSSPRYFSAFGRDVEVAESLLQFNPDSRHLDIVGGSRRLSKTEDALAKLMKFLSVQEGPVSGNWIQKNIERGYGSQVWRDALKEGAARGLIRQGYKGWTISPEAVPAPEPEPQPEGFEGMN
jgi:hypothetical protein